MLDTVEIDGKALFFALLRRVHWIILSVVLAGAGAFLAVRHLVPPQYTSALSLYVNNAPDSAVTRELNDINASQKLVNTYSVILCDDAVLDRVAQALMEEYPIERLNDALFLAPEAIPDGEALRARIEMSAVDDTEILRVAAGTRDPEVSARICTLIAEFAPEVLARVIQAGSVEAIGTAKPAKTPSRPRLGRAAVIGALLGGFLSGLWISIREVTDPTIGSADELKRRLGLPILGEVPSEKRKNDSDERYKIARERLFFRAEEEGAKTILVASAQSGEGAPEVCARLAREIARTGAKVLVIDASLRHPILHERFELSNERGASSLLMGADKFATVLRTVEPHLDVITAGEAPPNPAELLGTENMRILLRKMEVWYDRILVYSAPLGTADAAALCRMVPGVLLVACRARSTVEALEQAMEQMQFSDAKLLGVVVTGDDHAEKAFL